MTPINKILFISLSNIGDAILTLPVLDVLQEKYPQAKITVMSGPRPQDVFNNRARVNKNIVYDKYSSWQEKFHLFLQLKKEKFDLVVDLRNSAFGFFLPVRYKYLGLRPAPKRIKHAKDRHLWVVRKLISGINCVSLRPRINPQDKLIVISCGARSDIKRWPKESFSLLVNRIAQELKAKIVLVGDKNDIATNQYIASSCGCPVTDLSGRTTIDQLTQLMLKASCVVTNDSANLHLASYLNVPVVAVFGPTDDQRYGPWSQRSAIAKKEIFCRPCRKAQCRFGNMQCMHLVSVDDVMLQIKNVLGLLPNCYLLSTTYKRILLIRTDRIGDVVLSTPAITALRQAYPQAFIAMMVRPYTKEVIQGNPYLDEMILYDKKNDEKNILTFWRFARKLRSRRFDLAIVLYPADRNNFLAFLSGAKKRIGYDMKMGFVLKEKLKHIKHLGQKHEMEYTLDLVRVLGIEPQDKRIMVTLLPQAEQWVDQLFNQYQLSFKDKLLIIHAGASCPSKIWPVERYAKVADILAKEKGFKVLVLAGPDALDQQISRRIIQNMQQPAIDLVGKISISQTASLIKRSQLMLCADTGPMHVAAALGIDLVVIMGRNQPGLSITRWKPLNPNSFVLHKDIGCSLCLAHKCQKNFACLSAISIEDVLAAVESLKKH